LDESNITKSWNSWLTQFKLSIEVASLNAGFEVVGYKQVSRFRGRRKRLALLGAVGSEGIDTLQLLGFDLNNNCDNEYELALHLLQSHYDRDDTFLCENHEVCHCAPSLWRK